MPGFVRYLAPLAVFLALAGLLASGLDPLAAARAAQDYTWRALRNGYRPGLGQHLPDRLFRQRADGNGD